MLLNEEKVGRIIFEQRNVIEERYDGYKDRMVTMIGKILVNERRHRVSPTNIQTRINDMFQKAAWSLAKERSSEIGTEE